MLRRGLAYAGAASLVVTAALVAPSNAVADDEPEVDAGDCGTYFCIGVETEKTSPGSSPEEAPRSNSKVECKLSKVDPPPPAGHPVWKESGADKDDDGDVYFRACIGAPDGSDYDGFVFVPEGEPAPTVDPLVLAERAVDRMALRGPQVASPDTEGTYLVGMPMWLWVTPSPTTYGPNSASASAGGVTVTAEAQVTRIVWSMGDGTQVTCTKPGTPYKASFGKKRSPDCGHVYRKSSKGQTGGSYSGTATATWAITWAGGGQSGDLTTTRSTDFEVPVGQAAALN